MVRQVSLSMGFSRQEYWNRLPCPSPGDLPNPGMEPMSPALAGGFFTTEPPGKPIESLHNTYYLFMGWNLEISILFPPSEVVKALLCLLCIEQEKILHRTQWLRAKPVGSTGKAVMELHLGLWFSLWLVNSVISSLISASSSVYSVWSSENLFIALKFTLFIGLIGITVRTFLTGLS